MAGQDYRFSIRDEQRFQDIERKLRRRRMRQRKVRVTNSGVPIPHNLGVVPDEYSIIPLSDVTWWFYREPDSINIYLKSSESAEFLVSVSGG